MRDVVNIDDKRTLRIVHVLRAPLGGLFRHVIDLTREQVARGHAVGLVTDSLTGGDAATRVLAELEPSLALGITRLPMRRNPHVTDAMILSKIVALTQRVTPDVLHGHGSKGGFYARCPGLLPNNHHAIRAYTPHGGSFNYRPGTALNKLYMGVEGILERATDILLFESAYIAGRYREFVGQPRTRTKIVLNGISPKEFVPIVPNDDAADLVYVGELRAAKGIDTLLDAVAEIASLTGAPPTLVLVGTGPDKTALTEHAARLGLTEYITFPGLLPAREAFRRGRLMVVPSRAESLPYIVLEAAGAQIPLVSTNVGGIPEIFGPFSHRLIACNDPSLLARRILRAMKLDDAQRKAEAAELADFVSSQFSISSMVDAVLEGYREAQALAAGTRHLTPMSVSLQSQG